MIDRIDTWIFDLDNTLYPAECNLFGQIDLRMKTFIAQDLGISEEEAFVLQKKYFREHGTTLRGLMDNHGTLPGDFLDFVHDIDHSVLPAMPELAAAIEKLPGRKIIFTNGTVHHARGVMNALGVHEHFEEIFDIVAADYIPKPNPAPYARIVERHEINTSSAVLIEDIAKNLKPAKDLGMTTVFLRTDTRWSQPDGEVDYIDHEIDNLSDWLNDILSAAKSPAA
jgi:putative hydrolase of the HAD superfamily